MINCLILPKGKVDSNLTFQFCLTYVLIFCFLYIMEMDKEEHLQTSKSRKNFASRLTSGILIFFLVVIVLAVLLYFSGIPYFTNLTPCYPPPWVSEDGVATAEVHVFYDANQNGAHDDGERSLPNIQVNMGPEFAITDENGLGTVYLFKEGCPCKCSRNETLNIQVPSGWAATTPTQILLTGEDVISNFGLIKN